MGYKIDGLHSNFAFKGRLISILAQVDKKCHRKLSPKCKKGLARQRRVFRAYRMSHSMMLSGLYL